MLAVNIPADGLFLAIQNAQGGDLSKDNCERIINEYIDRFLEAKPDIIFLNVCYRRCLTPSEVFDSYLYNVETDENGYAIKNGQLESVKTFSPVTDNVSKYFMSFVLCARELLKSGIDIYQFAIHRIRQTECRVFLSVRMNDAHYTENAAINSSFALKNECKNTIEHNGENLDYSKEAVRNYYYSYLDELLQKYDIDGIELDWLRYPSVLPYDKRGDLNIISDYMKRIRRLAGRYKKDLAVRILATEEENLCRGLDACMWIADGSVDIITIENFYIPTNYELPVCAWRESIKKKNADHHSYQLLCGSDWAVSCMSRYNIAMTPALVRGFADVCFENGADGVYLFNFFEQNDTSSFEFVNDKSGGAHLRNCFSERIKAARSWECLPRRYVHIGNSNKRYPISLPFGDFYAFSKKIKSSFETCRVVIGIDSDALLSVYANGSLMNTVKKENVCKGFEYIPENEIGIDNHFIYALTQAAPVVLSVDLPKNILENESVHVKIQNDFCDTIKIMWIEIVCE